MKKKASPNKLDDISTKRKKKCVDPEEKVLNFESNLTKRLSFKEELDRVYESEKKEKLKVYDNDILNGYKFGYENNSNNTHIQDNLSENFLYDHSIIKQLDINITIDFSQLDKDLEELKTFFESQNLVYYEYTNAASHKDNLVSHMETNKYEYYFENTSDNFDKNKNQVINYTNYAEALISLLKNFNTNESSFYLITPLISIYFFKINPKSGIWINKHLSINESGILISNAFNDMEKKLNDFGVRFSKITQKQMKKDKKKNGKVQIDDIYSQYHQVNDNFEERSNSLIYMKNYFIQHFFNFFINEYEDKYFKVMSQFPFENCQYKTCKVQFETFSKNEKSNICIKILGCLFSNQLELIIDFLQEKFSSFSLKITHFYRTNGFYIINSKLDNFVEKSEFFDNHFGHK